MYTMYFNVNKQRIEILRQGEEIAFRPLPTHVVPNPGRAGLLAQQGNQEAYNLIHDLVADAEDGCGMER